LQLQKAATFFIKSAGFGALHLRRNLNALSQQLFQQSNPASSAGYAD
jgi:hypothetical protein